MRYKDPEKQREADRRWRAANLEGARAREAAYRAANREARRALLFCGLRNHADSRRLLGGAEGIRTSDPHTAGIRALDSAAASGLQGLLRKAPTRLGSRPPLLTARENSHRRRGFPLGTVQ